jgi:superfamily II DNA helicase RecQ
MGATQTKQSFDDIVSQLKRNNITVVSTHGDRRYLYAVMKKDDILFVVRQFIKTEKFSLRHDERGIFFFNTVEEALDIVNSLKKKEQCKITASLWDAEHYYERELRFTFHTYDVQEAAKEYEHLKTKLAKMFIELRELTPKMQAICVLPQLNVDAVKTMTIMEFGMKWQDFSKKQLRFAVAPSFAPSYPHPHAHPHAR